jgi:hypothetical protein
VRVSNAFSGRPAQYDRNAININTGLIVAATGPHATTTRFSYTVPAARKCQIGTAFVRTRRVTVAAPVGLTGAFVQDQSLVTYYAVIQNTLNAIDNIDSMVVSSSGILVAGTVVLGRTTDLGTGGTVEYVLGLTGQEFDA